MIKKRITKELDSVVWLAKITLCVMLCYFSPNIISDVPTNGLLTHELLSYHVFVLYPYKKNMT